MRVDVQTGSSPASGRLLSVEKQRKQNGKGDYTDVTTFAIVTDGGEMRNFELGRGTSVRIAERDLTDEVGRYLNLVGSSRARDLRRMMIAATGSGDRDVFVSYISEVPVWKSTYRILPDKTGEKPLLQGWAIVDNTVGEDWKDVQLSIRRSCAGRDLECTACPQPQQTNPCSHGQRIGGFFRVPDQ